ncbi:MULTISPECIES: EAL domain-containing protein [unclassified Rhizobium]|uniref:bifunctional diguanylate cyclase/phosphodiesterase n=1 Tax=unclassified Rhizobium TaxID=2613769 RepID=UPI0006F9D139|nr:MULTISPECIES: EAL domain-containing protein [unclassified Rhizobium]KQV37645.1 diguanylate phosphodiesterase [Rhizobium sp. Root1212]KRD34547.1 diguanylate phosphodiesterase [Rhizobium sp. Root268]
MIHRIRSSSRKARVAVVTAIFTCVIGLIASIIFTAVVRMKDDANNIDDARAGRAVTSAIRSFQARLGSTVRDNAVWDDAYTKIGSPDGAAWAYENWGKTTEDYPLYDVAIVLTPTRNVLNAYNKGAAFDPARFFGNSLFELAKRASLSGQRGVTAFVPTADGIYLVAAGAIQPYITSPSMQNFSTLFFAKLLTPEVVEQLDETFDIGGLKLVASPDREGLSIPLLGDSGRSVAYLQWPSRMPGNLTFNAVYKSLLVAGVLFVSFLMAIVATAIAVVRGLHRDALSARFKATHDSLTGLMNRAGLLDGIKASRSMQGDGFALALVDLDGFKEVNDAWGHAIGDQLIKLVAGRMKETLPQTQIICRLGGDEFAFLGATKAIEESSGALIRALHEPFRIGGRTIEVGASIGISPYSSDVSDGYELLRRADMALYEAKESGRGRVVSYLASLDVQRLHRAEMEDKLRRAIENGEVRPAFQPLVDAKTGSLRGVEALARWVPETGPISPEVFIAVAERAGLIDELGRQILEISVETASSWDDVGLSVNLSPVQLRNPDFAALVQSVLEMRGFDPYRLTLEVTEGVLMSNPEQAKRTIARLKSIGVKFALDDFGCGYASIGALREFGFDRMKIDRSLVTALQDSKGAGILNATLSLAKALEIPVTAEGVETQEQADSLAESGCDQLQGYLVGRPMSAQEIEEIFLRVAA